MDRRPIRNLPSRAASRRILTGDLTKKERLIVGIDYGTTFSGISYCFTTQSDVKDIMVVRNWPGKSDARKTPSRIAYVEENPHLNERKWGFLADSKVVSCAWTKLLLDSGSDYQTYDDPLLQSATATAIFHLPNHRRDPGSVCEDFLKEVYLHMIEHLKRKITREVLDITPMDCRLTLPATWSDRAKEATKAAAKRAGFGNRPIDGPLLTITEPEAAALYALKYYEPGESLNPIREKENILICDCGGGTVDITTYSVFTTSPLQFEELCEGTGGKCGSTFIDRNLHELMKKRFGVAFDAVPFVKKGPGSRFMEDFEILKSDFKEYGGNDDDRELTLRMKLEESEIYDPDDGTFKLSRQDMKNLFDPVVERVIELVESQVNKVKETKGKIDRIILVGGFGDSPYLYEKLKDWSKMNGGASVICPEHPQSAIVIGAALRGLEGLKPRKRKCRRHYGVGVGMPFRRGKDPEQFKYKDAASKSDFCSGRAHWLLAKGATITNETKATVPVEIHVRQGQSQIAELELFSCSLVTAPDRVDDERVNYVGKILVDLESCLDDESSSRKNLKYGGKDSYSASAELQVEFGNDSGLLQFKALVDGKAAGKASIEFD